MDTISHLHPHEIEIWTARLDDRASIPKDDPEILSVDESARAARFKFVRDAQRYATGRRILRNVLAGYLGCPSVELAFQYGEFGKPRLAAQFSGSKLQFNLAHCADVMVISVCLERAVGIDVEHIQKEFADQHVAERFFAPHEVSALRSLPTNLQTEAFFNCWTRKEAYIKARGGGLEIPLHSFEVSLVPGEAAAFLNGADGWSLQSFTPTADHVAAVAASGEDWTLNHRGWLG